MSGFYKARAATKSCRTLSIQKFLQPTAPPSSITARGVHRIIAGLRLVAPALATTAVWGLVVGVAIVKTGVTIAQALGMTLLVYAGSAQLAALPLPARALIGIIVPDLMYVPRRAGPCLEQYPIARRAARRPGLSRHAQHARHHCGRDGVDGVAAHHVVGHAGLGTRRAERTPLNQLLTRTIEEEISGDSRIQLNFFK